MKLPEIRKRKLHNEMYIIGPIGQYVRLLCYKSIRGNRGGGYAGVVSHFKRLDKDCSVCIHLINIGFL